MKKIIVIVLLLTLSACSDIVNHSVITETQTSFFSTEIDPFITERKYVIDISRANPRLFTASELDKNATWEYSAPYGSQRALVNLVSRIYFSETEKITDQYIMLKAHVNDVWSFSWTDRCYYSYDNGDRNYMASSYNGITIADVTVKKIICFNESRQVKFDSVAPLLPIDIYIAKRTFWVEKEDGGLSNISYNSNGYVPKPGLDLLIVVTPGRNSAFENGESFVRDCQIVNEKVNNYLSDGYNFSTYELSDFSCDGNTECCNLIDFYPINDLDGNEICDLDQFHSYLLKLDEKYKEKGSSGYEGLYMGPWYNETIRGLFLGNPVGDNYLLTEFNFKENGLK